MENGKKPTYVLQIAAKVKVEYQTFFNGKVWNAVLKLITAKLLAEECHWNKCVY